MLTDLTRLADRGGQKPQPLSYAGKERLHALVFGKTLWGLELLFDFIHLLMPENLSTPTSECKKALNAIEEELSRSFS
jgi:hypothetical protein